MCNTECCNNHFPEWKKESTWCWFFVQIILILIVAGIYCTISGAEQQGEVFGPRILEPQKALIVVMFMIFVGFLTVIYARYQHQIAPWWFKVLALVLYFGTLAFFFWEFHIAENGGVLPDNSNFNTNKRPFDMWTINHTFVGVLFGVMYPFWWMVIVVVGWEFIEILVYGAGDEDMANAIVDVVVAIIGWWFVILIFSRKCIPWISAKCAAHSKHGSDRDHLEPGSPQSEHDGAWGQTEMGAVGSGVYV